MKISQIGAAVTLAALGVALVSGAAMAHPLGNFTISRFSGLELGGTDLRIHYVVDMAEIPAYQEKQNIGAGKTYRDNGAYLDQLVPRLTSNLSLDIDGHPATLRVSDRSLSFPPGQAGLATMRIEVLYTVPALSLGTHSLAYRDSNYADRLGWKEIIAAASGGAQLRGASVPSHSASNELRSYPLDRLTSPLDVTQASMTLAPGLGDGSLPPFLDKARGGFRVVQDRYSELVAARDLTPVAIALSLALAVGLGAAHALSPGHGKAVMAAYLVGTRRSPHHAAILGATITATHTIGVFALGAVTLLASAIVTPERLYPYLALASGLMVAALGISLVISRTRLALGTDELSAAHTGPGAELVVDGHQHTPHRHGLAEHTHEHLRPGAGMGALVAMGVAGGLLPCPSALIVMLSAIALHRVAFGLVLIVAFSLGLALMLTGLGVALAAGAPLLTRLPWQNKLPSGLRAARVISVGAALVITIAGIVLTVEAVPALL
jgi:ABC-type nickel/cobalt efflux system permease component RcnA